MWPCNEAFHLILPLLAHFCNGTAQYDSSSRPEQRALSRCHDDSCDSYTERKNADRAVSKLTGAPLCNPVFSSTIDCYTLWCLVLSDDLDELAGGRPNSYPTGRKRLLAHYSASIWLHVRLVCPQTTDAYLHFDHLQHAIGYDPQPSLNRHYCRGWLYRHLPTAEIVDLWLDQTLHSFHTLHNPTSGSPWCHLLPCSNVTIIPWSHCHVRYSCNPAQALGQLLERVVQDDWDVHSSLRGGDILHGLLHVRHFWLLPLV